MNSIVPLDISGPIDSATPFVVLIEIYESYGGEATDIAIEQAPKILRTILRLTPEPIARDCLAYPRLARLVNPSVLWTHGKLRKAFKFLLAPTINRDFRAGRQSPKDLYAINARILYRRCRELGFSLSLTTTLEEMAAMVRLAMFPPPDIYLYLSNRLGELPLTQLIELTIKVGLPEKRSGQVTYPILDRETTDPEQAIAIVAYHYNVDISESMDPILAYSLVKDSHNLFCNPDTRQHPERYPCLNYHFNPSLPLGYYSNNALTSLMAQEGLTATTREDSYNRLVEIHRGTTFRLTGTATTTLIYNLDVSQISFGKVVFLGDTALTLEELKDYFVSCCNLINPASETQELLTSQQIRKLKAICRNYPSEEASNLLEQIDRIEQILSCSCRQHSDFIKDFRLMDTRTRELIVAIFWSLHKLAMYMRGWDGQGPLPITQAPVDNQCEVDVRVTEAIADLDDKLHALPEELRRRIMELNLYCQREDGLRVSTPQDTVPTFGLRLELVRGGNDLETIESCIRVSSNYFAATSHYYLRSLGETPPYDLSALRYIS
jgi:hypothetical protein